nr:ATP-binding protein [Waterburya agarophytonicola]
MSSIGQPLAFEGAYLMRAGEELAPTIKVERFIDEYRSRNEKLADIMRRFNICEEKGSGIDKVIDAAETYQLPAPDFRVGETPTTAILFAHQDFSDMSKSDRT